MNKQMINQELDSAYRALCETKIADDELQIDKTYRGQIATFGAAIMTGSLLSAIAFFSDDGGSSVHRSKLLEAILFIMKEQKQVEQSCSSLFDYAKKNESIAKEHILNAAIALKLAMNMFILVEKK